MTCPQTSSAAGPPAGISPSRMATLTLHAQHMTTARHHGAQLIEDAWKLIKDNDFLSGMYIWTGFDYLGEPTPYWWPARSSYFGIIDLAGFPKDAYYMYQSEWTDRAGAAYLPSLELESGTDG